MPLREPRRLIGASRENGDSIALFEDDANAVVASAEAYAEKVSSVMRRLPRWWDLLSFGRAQLLSRVLLQAPESSGVPTTRIISDVHHLLQDDAHLRLQTRRASNLRGAPDDVIDMLPQRASARKLKIYVACDNGIVDQATSEFQSLGG